MSEDAGAVPDGITRYFAAQSARDFEPGGTVDLRDRFTVAADKIHRLAIAP